MLVTKFLYKAHKKYFLIFLKYKRVKNKHLKKFPKMLIKKTGKFYLNFEFFKYIIGKSKDLFWCRLTFLIFFSR